MSKYDFKVSGKKINHTFNGLVYAVKALNPKASEESAIKDAILLSREIKRYGAAGYMNHNITQPNADASA